MENFGTNAAPKIQHYLTQHRLLQQATRLVSAKPCWLDWPQQQALGDHAAGKKRQFIAANDAYDNQGNPCHLLLVRDPVKPGMYEAYLKPHHTNGELPPPVTLHQRPDGMLELADGSMVGDRFLYDHQFTAIADYASALAKNAEQENDRTSREVVAFATGTGKSYIVGHTIKALGQQGVVIVPETLRDQIAKELREVMPTATINTGADFSNAPPPDDFNGVLVLTEGPELNRFLGSKENPGWLLKGSQKFVAIDEAHELTMRQDANTPAPGRKALELLAQHHHVMAVTATPNAELFEALGIPDRDPASVMTMFDAAYRLRTRAFRPLTLERKQVGTPQDVKHTSQEERERLQSENEPAMRFEALAGYFGRDEYKGIDYFLDPEQDRWVPRSDAKDRFTSAKSLLPAIEQQHETLQRVTGFKPDVSAQNSLTLDFQETAIIEAMKENRVRYAEHKHIAFGIRPALVKNLAADLQAIHDGTYENMKTLHQEVWLRRAQSAIAEYIREYRREFGCTNRLKKFLKQKNLEILMAERSEMLEDTDKNEDYRAAMRSINPEDFKDVLPQKLFDDLIQTPEAIDLTAEAQQASKNTARNAQVKEGEKTYYALAVVTESDGSIAVYNGTEKTDLTADQVVKISKEGKVMHIADETRKFATGFSDKKLMMTTRIVENMGDYVVHATQVLGRPIRDTDSLAALHEIVGPFVNLQGELGVDRYFSCYDVVSEYFLERSKEYQQNFVNQGRGVWRPGNGIPITAEKKLEEASPRQIGKQRAG